MKKVLLLLLVIVMGISFVACSQEQTTTTTETIQEETVLDETESTQEETDVDVTEAESNEIILTTDELSNYDGKEGNPAYIAVDGVIYDVTESSLWAEGEHNGFEAGRDLSEELREESPHGESVLDRFTAVGRIED